MPTAPLLKRNASRVPLILNLTAFAALFLLFYQQNDTYLFFSRLYHRLLVPLTRLLVYLSLGLIVGQLLEASGWLSGPAHLIRPILRWGRFRDECSAAVISGLFSSTVANTMLMGYYQEGKLNRRELILAYLLNNGLPVYLTHLPTTFFVSISLAGAAGSIYLFLTFLAAFARSLLVIVYSRLTMPQPTWFWSPILREAGEIKSISVLGILRKFRTRLMRLASYTLPIYCFVFLASEWGILSWLKIAGAAIVPGNYFPLELTGPIVFTFGADFSSGMAVAGALISAGTVSTKQASLALVLGTLISTPIRAVRYQIPSHAGLFRLGLGSELLGLSQSMRIISILLVTAPYALCC
jgi:hypothetical protein